MNAMVTWTAFTRHAPAMVAAGRKLFYQWDVALGFLATVRSDGGPRTHPVCPIVTDEGLFVLIQTGPKQADLLRDGRYALHSETCPPPRQDDAFYLTGRAHRVGDAEVEGQARAHMVAERNNPVPWPSFPVDVLFELTIETCMLILTEAADGFPAGPTVWKAAQHEG
ncbi:MAG: pyridoxamine 5'-phosphate oxidase family protein [Chloroflexota bacterium]